MQHYMFHPMVLGPAYPYILCCAKSRLHYKSLSSDELVANFFLLAGGIQIGILWAAYHQMIGYARMVATVVCLDNLNHV